MIQDYCFGMTDGLCMGSEDDEEHERPLQSKVSTYLTEELTRIPGRGETSI